MVGLRRPCWVDGLLTASVCQAGEDSTHRRETARMDASALRSNGGGGQSVELSQDGSCRCLPDERLWVCVVLGEVALDGGLQVDKRVEAAATDAFSGQDEKKFSTAFSHDPDVGVK